MEQTKKIEFFMLIKSYNFSQLSAKILEGKTFDVQRNWQLNWAVFSKERLAACLVGILGYSIRCSGKLSARGKL